MYIVIITTFAHSIYCLLLHMREDAQATRHYCVDNDALVNSMPSVQQTLLSFL